MSWPDQFPILICIQLWRFDILEDASIARSVEELGRQHIVYAHYAKATKEDDGKQRPDWRSKIVQPLVAPEPGDQSRAKTAGRIEADAEGGRSLPGHEHPQNPGHQRGPPHEAMPADEAKSS